MSRPIFARGQYCKTYIYVYLCVEDLSGEARVRHYHEVANAEAEEEDGAVFRGHAGEEAVVEVVADLQPVSEDRNRGRARRSVGTSISIARKEHEISEGE